MMWAYRLGVVIALLSACTDKSDDDYRAEIVASIHDSLGEDLDTLVGAALNLQAASPSRKWNPVADEQAITEMREAWKRMRTAYEHIEGAIVALFPGVESTLDGRYEDMIARHRDADDRSHGDRNLFDDRGVTGMHAIERILYAPVIRPEVIAFESNLDGYQEAAYPATDDDAIAFKTLLVQLLIDNAGLLRKRWEPGAIDVGNAYHGLIGLMNEQKEKVNLAVTGEEESRYANLTMFDLRCNLQGTTNVYGVFRAWIQSKASGPSSDAALRGKFNELERLYATMSSDALPETPRDWRRDQPTAANLETPFGTLWKHLHETADPQSQGSVVFEMNQIATILGLPAFAE